ncbi:hypothetical protein [Scytonema sp. PRP1]
MANIKINKLKLDTNKSEEMIDLKAENTDFTAFKTLRGGLAASKPCWRC